VPFGARAPDGAAACDGLVPGSALDLSHWENNETPAALKRDTSVEIALAFARTGEHVKVAVNNHFDADGALAVFALLRSDVALAHERLLVAAAEAGDFDEWPDDERGLRLEASVRRLGMLRTEADAYTRVIRELPDVLAKLDAREDLWGAAWRHLSDAREAVLRGDVQARVTGVGPSAIATFVHRAGVAELPGPVLHRAARDASGAPFYWALIAFERPNGVFDYRLERARYAWAETVRRPPLAPPSRNFVATALSRALDTPFYAWALKGDLGMTGILRTAAPIARTPDEVARAVCDAARGTVESQTG
jgi:hypothetical protein